MGKARFFLTGSLIFLVVNFLLVVYRLDFIGGQDYLFYLNFGILLVTVLCFFSRYFFWLLLILAAIIRYQYWIQPELWLQENFVFDKKYSFTAEIVDLDKKINGWQITLQPLDLPNYPGKIMVYTGLYPEYQNRQIVSLECKLTRPEPIIDEFNREFYYDKYLAARRIFANCFRPPIRVIGENKGWLKHIQSGRQYFWNNLNVYLIEPASNLAKATMLADTKEMPDNLRQIFSQTGLSHVIAISGSHIVIIAWLLQALLAGLFLSRQQSFWALVIIFIIYLWLLGFPSSAVRSALMVMLVLIGPYLGRTTASVYGLLLAADILVLINPYLLVYDVGFQLSFLAVLGLLLYSRWLEKILAFIPTKLKIREMVSVTLAAQVFTWPVIVYNFHIFSMVAPLANVIVLPFLPAILVLCIALSLLGAWPWLATLISWPLYLLLKLIVVVASYLAGLPLSYFEVKNFSAAHLWFSFLAILFLTWLIRPNKYTDSD